MIEDHEQHWSTPGDNVRYMLAAFVVGIAICSVAILILVWGMYGQA